MTLRNHEYDKFLIIADLVNDGNVECLAINSINMELFGEGGDPYKDRTIIGYGHHNSEFILVSNL